MSLHESSTHFQRTYTPEKLRQHNSWREARDRLERRPNPIVGAIAKPVEVSEPESELAAPAERDDRPPSFHLIKDTVASYYRVSVANMMSGHRQTEFVEPRHVAQYLCKLLTLASYPMVGRQFNRDSTSIISAVRKIAWRVEHNPEFVKHIEAIKAKIEASI